MYSCPTTCTYSGELDRGIVVVNHLKRRGRRLGVDVFERVRDEVPLDLVGMDSESLGGLGEVAPSELARFASRYRFFFNPIRYTSLGLAVIEAMMIGLPVVGLATTELATVIENGVSGFIGTDPGRLIEPMSDLLTDRRAAGRLGENAQRRTGTVLDPAIRSGLGRRILFRYRTSSPRPHSGQSTIGSLLMKRRVLWISEHASPLAVLGGVDSGGQNVYVDQIARELALAGHEVNILTRRERDGLPAAVELAPGVRVIHVPAGPAAAVRKEELLPFMSQFADFAIRYLRRRKHAYDLVHANFFMSALVASEIKRALGIPFVVTFHALGRVRRLHQGGADSFPDERLVIEDRAVAEADRIIAECPQDKQDLVKLYEADPWKIVTIPCGYSATEFSPISKAEARASLGLPADEPIILQLGRMVPRKGVDNVIRGLACLRRMHGICAHLLVVGGDSREPDPTATPEIGRLRAIAATEEVSHAVTFVGSRGRSELRLLRSGRRLRVDTLVRAFWNHARRSDGLRHAGHRIRGRRNQEYGCRRPDRLSGST